MIKHFNADYLSCLDKSPCNLHVFIRGFSVSRWVVMTEDNLRYCLENGEAKDFTGMDKGCVQGSKADQVDILYGVSGA